MRFVSAHAAAPRLAALVGDDELHAGWLADDAAGWRNTARDDVGDQPAHADAADFLIVRQREMQWPRKAAAEELRNEREADRAEALHVGDAAPVQAIAGERRFERIRVPRLSVDGHDIGMARQHDAASRRVAVARRKRGEQVRLAPIIVERERRRCAERFEVAPHPFDQFEIRVAAHRRIGDEAPDHLVPCEVFGTRRGRIQMSCRFGRVHDFAYAKRQDSTARRWAD